MRHLHSLGLVCGLSLFSLWFHLPVAAQSTPPNATMEDVKAKLNGKTMMDLMEMVAAKDPNYNGPAHLHPINKMALRKTFLPPYFETIDSLHETQSPSIDFTVGNGDQTDTFEAQDISNALLFLSGTTPDKPISSDLWGNLTARQLFEAFDIPKVETATIAFNLPNQKSAKLVTNKSQSANYLSIQAKDEKGVWVYSLELPLGSQPTEIKLSTRGNVETFKVLGLSSDKIRSIKVNDEVLFTSQATAKPNVALSKELGL